MTASSPVCKKIELPETVFAEDQIEYLPLPSYRSEEEDGLVVTRWRLSWRERFRILFFGELYLSILTFGKRLQPVKLEVKCPICAKPSE